MIQEGAAGTDRHARLVAALQDAAERAMDRFGACEARFDLAGRGLRIRYAGAALRDVMLPAMAHALAGSAGVPDPEVSVWDSARSGVVLPAAAGLPGDHTPFGLSRLRHSGPVFSFFDPWGCTLTVLDLEQGRGVHWMPDAADPPDSARAAPLQALINWWLVGRDRAVVHAAAVGTAAGAVLLLGSGSAGKSTTALACVDAGFSYLGDDLCAVTFEPRAVVHCVYCSAKILDRDLARFPRFASNVANPGRKPTQKAVAYLNRWDGDVVRRQLPLRAAIVLAGKGLASPRLERIAPAKALLAFAPGTFLNFPGHGRAELAALAKLVARVPCYRMGLAADPSANPTALRKLLEGPR